MKIDAFASIHLLVMSTDSKAQSETPGRVRELGSAIARGDAVLFVGAGVSAGSGLLNWTALVDELRSGLQPVCRETNPLLVAQFYRNQHGDHAFYSQLRKLFKRNMLTPNAAHHLLSALPSRVYITTNFDNLLEAALRAVRHVHVITSDQEVGLWDETEEVQVLKLHGDLDNAATIVLTEEDYVRFLFANKAIQRKLLDIFTFRTVIFVGYSLRDPNISLIYNNILYELGQLKRPAYILTFESDAHQVREWERRKIFPLTIPCKPGQTRHDALTLYLRAVRDEVARLSKQAPCDVMIVEDDEDDLNGICTLLGKQFPYAKIEIACDGLEGLMLIAKRHPRLAIIDLDLPRMGGWELIELLRHDADLRRTKIVLVTAMEVDYNRAATMGVSGILRKPFDVKALYAVVEEHLSAEDAHDGINAQSQA